MRKKASSTLVFGLGEQAIIGFNFLQKSAFMCESGTLNALSANQSWVLNGTDECHTSQSWVDLGVMVSEGSDNARAEEEFLRNWAWGLPAALYHFSVQGNSFLTLEQGEAKQLASAEALGLPDLHLDNSGYHTLVELNRTDLETGLLATMASRRSSRESANNPVSLKSTARLLFAGMGITGFTKNSIVDLPLSMTPSGGARNPYEAYLIAKSVDGLAQGIYHYSARSHSLGWLESKVPDHLSAIIGDQEWADDMAGMIILVANFERTMWKYDDPNAYRVVLIEAGHIGQNMLLAATDEGLAACPTAALNHNLLFDILDLPNRITCAPVYAIAFGST